MTADSATTDLQDLENYLKNAKTKGYNENDLNILLNVFQCPIFKTVCTVQSSLKELQKQSIRHPGLDAKNFNINNDGRLELLDLPQRLDSLSPSNESKDVLNESVTASEEDDEKRFLDNVKRAAKGREIAIVNLYKSQNECLGFNVVGLQAEQLENLGIFVKDIAKNGIADREGSLAIGDQILAIDSKMLDGDICHKKAIEILQSARGQIELIVAKNEVPKIEKSSSVNIASESPMLIKNTPKDLSTSSNNVGDEQKSVNKERNQELDQYLANEPGLEKFSQIELIELTNTDNKGLGFGILGGKSTGVVIKTILRGGVSDKDGRLKSGDHILQINNVPLRGMSSEQVAQVLRSSGTNVKLLVARQKANNSTGSSSFGEQTNFSSLSKTEVNTEPETHHHLSQSETFVSSNSPFDKSSIEEKQDSNQSASYETKHEEKVSNGFAITSQESEKVANDENELDEQEVESIEVELVKDRKGLGITIAGYVCEREDISGIYVKSIAPGSAADLSGKIQLNDQIIEVDGISLLEFSNHEAVDVLRNTGKVVRIKLARYLKGGRFDRLQIAISSADFNAVKPLVPSKPSDQTILQVNTGDTTDNASTFVAENQKCVDSSSSCQIQDYWQKLLGDEYEIVIASFNKFEKNGGLGISLEGTIEEEPGKEAKPHHYIESILRQGPVGLNGVLREGDEILQVNAKKIYNMEHTEVVRLLKDLPINVCMICARLKPLNKSVIELTNQPTEQMISSRVEASDNQSETIESQDTNLLSTTPLSYNHQLLLNQQERLVKAKSDGSLAIVNSSLEILSKIKSRSLEPLSGLAMWNSMPVTIELTKGDRGLGFSILDYEDPLNSNESVIVIRSLVQGGVAQQSGSLFPGDRLLAVNDISLENASLDLAVQALKGAPKGIVRLLVAKPLPIADERQQNPSADLNYANLSASLNNGKKLDHSQTLSPASNSGIDLNQIDELEQQRL